MAQALRRSLSFVQLTFFGVGTIVGAGIYSVIGAAIGIAGPGVWISFIAASVAALLAALSYAELASMFSRAGAEYQYFKEAFPRLRLLSFLAGYLIALNAAATSATVALAFAGYLKVFVDVPTLLTAFALLAACTAVNIAGIRESTWVSITLICIEVAGLLLMIGGGFATGDVGRVLAVRDGLDPLAIFAATALLFFMFIGFEDVANLSEEAKEPERNVPRALVIAVAITSIVYLLVCFAVLAVAPPEELARSDSPLTTAGRRVAPWLGTTLAVTAMFATASTALIALISISRLLFGMGREGDMPAVLARVVSARQTPWVAALVLFAAACALIPLGNVKTTASVSALGILTVFVGVHAALIALRFSDPRRERPFRAPWSIGRVSVTAVLGLLAAVALMTQFEPLVYAVFAVALAVGVGVFVVHRRKRPARAAGS